MELVEPQSDQGVEANSDQLFTASLERCPLPTLVLENGSACIRYANKAATTLLGEFSEPIVGRCITEFTDTFCAQELNRRLGQLDDPEPSSYNTSLPFTFNPGAVDEKAVSLTLSKIDARHVAVYAEPEKPTHLRKSARELIDRELLMETLTEICRWEVDLQTGRRYWSPEVMRIFALDSEAEAQVDYEILAKFVHPADRERIAGLHRAARSHGQGYYARFRIVTKDGETRTIEDRCKADFDAQGRPVRLIGATRDITELRDQENELLQLHEIVNAVPGPVMVTDASNGVLCFANKAAAVKYGSNQQEMIGRLTRDVIGAKLHKQLQQRYATDLVNDEIVTSVELDLTTDADSPEWYRYIMRKFTIDERTFVISISVDISERKKAELELKRAYARVEDLCRQRAMQLDVKTQQGKEYEKDLKLSEERFFDIASSLADGIWETDASFKFTYLEDSIREILGIPEEDFSGLMCGYVQENVASRNEWLSFRENLDKMRPFRDVRFRYVNPQDGEGYFSMNGVPVFSASGEFKGYRGTGIEVSADVATEHRARKVQSEILAAKEEAERANKAKSEFLSSMSHELRTPLNSILGFAQLLEMTCAESDEKQTEYVNHILLAGQELLNLISQILELSTLEKGRISLRMEEVCANDVIDDSLKDVQFIAQQRKIRLIDNRAPQQQWPLLWADNSRLKQVLINLLTNAIKFNLDGGTVSIDCTEGANNCLRISVTDSGLGIPSDSGKNLFQPFERMGRETGDVPGSGVGLSIAKRIMDLIGGDINFTSRSNVGTTFWVDVPIARESKEDITGHYGTRSSIQVTRNLNLAEEIKITNKVLYIEDDPGSQELMMHILNGMRELSIEIVQAHNAELGLALAEEKAPDVILMDINLPGMDGVDAVQRLKRQEQTRHIPVVAISGDESVVTGSSAGNLGFDAFIAKPLKIKAVQDVVHRYLEH